MFSILQVVAPLRQQHQVESTMESSGRRCVAGHDVSSVPIPPTAWLHPHRRTSATIGTLRLYLTPPALNLWPSTAKYAHEQIRMVFCTTTEDTKSTKGLQDIPFNAVFQFGYVEVDEQTRLDPCQSQVCQQLCRVNSFEIFDGLQAQPLTRGRQIPSFVLFVSFVVIKKSRVKNRWAKSTKPCRI